MNLEFSTFGGHWQGWGADTLKIKSFGCKNEPYSHGVAAKSSIKAGPLKV